MASAQSLEVNVALPITHHQVAILIPSRTRISCQKNKTIEKRKTESILKVILDVTFNMSMKLDECHVERAVWKFVSFMGLNFALVRRALVVGTELLEGVYIRL